MDMVFRHIKRQEKKCDSLMVNLEYTIPVSYTHLVSHELLPMDSELWKQQESITAVRSDLIWQQSETAEKSGIEQR